MSIISFLGLGPVFDVDPMTGYSDDEMGLLFERYLAGDTTLPPEIMTEFDIQTKNAPPSVDNQQGTFSINGPPPAYADIEKGLPMPKPKHVASEKYGDKSKSGKKSDAKK